MKNNKFKVAGYLRLSVEDGDKEVSDSIVSQKNIIEDKIKKTKKINIGVDKRKQIVYNDFNLY